MREIVSFNVVLGCEAKKSLLARKDFMKLDRRGKISYFNTGNIVYFKCADSTVSKLMRIIKEVNPRGSFYDVDLV